MLYKSIGVFYDRFEHITEIPPLILCVLFDMQCHRVFAL